MVVSENVVATAYQATEPLHRLYAYRWRVAVDGAISGDQSPWLRFQVGPLTAPEPTVPQGVINTARPLFRWQEVEGAESYRLGVLDEETGVTALLADTSETVVQLGGDLTGSRYRWRVSAQDGGLAWPSQWSRFAIRPPRDTPGPRDRR